jgi:hypothetical protein
MHDRKEQGLAHHSDRKRVPHRLLMDNGAETMLPDAVVADDLIEIVNETNAKVVL